MDELSREVQAASEALQPRWDDARAAQLFAGVGALRRRRTVARVGAASLAVAAATLFALTGPGNLLGESAGPVLVSAGDVAGADTVHSGHKLRLVDGSLARLRGAQSELRIVQNTETNVRLELVSGRAHFDVVPNELRSFIVSAGAYRVVVIGTIFDVTRGSDRIEVAVDRGKVRVYGPRGATDLAAGESHAFPVDVSAESQGDGAGAAEDATQEATEEATEESAPRRHRARRARDGEAGSWRSLHQSGDYEGAFALLEGGASVPDEASALMDAADAARLSGHPRGAVSYLERVVRDHGRSPVAPLAAFTLGRVYLDRLGQPHRAAESFGQARRLAPRGSLAQDALAREVEALSKAGQAQDAYARAQEYLQAYPNGRRLRAVRLFGGLD